MGTFPTRMGTFPTRKWTRRGRLEARRRGKHFSKPWVLTEMVERHVVCQEQAPDDAFLRSHGQNTKKRLAVIYPEIGIGEQLPGNVLSSGPSLQLRDLRARLIAPAQASEYVGANRRHLQSAGQARLLPLHSLERFLEPPERGQT